MQLHCTFLLGEAKETMSYQFIFCIFINFISRYFCYNFIVKISFNLPIYLSWALPFFPCSGNLDTSRSSSSGQSSHRSLWGRVTGEGGLFTGMWLAYLCFSYYSEGSIKTLISVVLLVILTLKGAILIFGIEDNNFTTINQLRR